MSLEIGSASSFWFLTTQPKATVPQLPLWRVVQVQFRRARTTGPAPKQLELRTLLTDAPAQLGDTPAVAP